MKCLLTCGIMLFIFGCGGGRQLATPTELQPWVGRWVGTGIRENQNSPARVWTLVLRIDGNRLAGAMSDDQGEMNQTKIMSVKLNNGTLSFKIRHESMRGLVVFHSHRARLKGHKLLSEYEGMEGGRSFRGKWEARLIHEAERSTAEENAVREKP